MERRRLDTDRFVTVTNIKMVPTEYGQAMILTLLNIGEVWGSEHLKTKIMNSDTYFNPPFYLRPLGMKQCKDHPRKSIAHMIWFLIMESILSKFKYNKTFFDILGVDHSQTQIY